MIYLKAKNKTVVFLTSLVFLLLVSPYKFLFGWGAVNLAASHQFILKEAYKLLEKDLVFQRLKEKGDFDFPSLDEILANEGVNWIASSLTGGFFSGPGPDSEGNALWSDHYYNPRTNKGNAPNAAAKYYDMLRKSLEKGAGNTSQYAAYLAHFVADMSVPYHINGMPAEDAIYKHYAPGVGILQENVVGQTDEGPRDWSAELRRWHAYFEKYKDADWFDPWYWDGMTLLLIDHSKTSTHLRWEFDVHRWPITVALDKKIASLEKFVGLGSPDQPLGYTDDFLNLQKKHGNGTQNTAREFTKSVARFTYQNQEKWWQFPTVDTINELTNIRRPEQFRKVWGKAFAEAIRNVYTIWRASFSALRPDFKIELDPRTGKNILNITIERLDFTDNPKQMKVRAKIEGGELNGPKWPEWHTVELSPDWGETFIADVWEVKNADDNAKITVEVKGQFDKIPDSGGIVTEKNIVPVSKEFKPELPIPVEFEEEDVSRIDPSFTRGYAWKEEELDPNSLYNPIALLREDRWGAPSDPTKGIHVAIFNIEQYGEKQRAREVFDHNCKELEKTPKYRRQYEQSDEKAGVKVDSKNQECRVEYTTHRSIGYDENAEHYPESRVDIIYLYRDTFLIRCQLYTEEGRFSDISQRWQIIRQNSENLINERLKRK